MVSKNTSVLEGCLSRRDVLKGLAGFMIAVSLESCAQALSSSSTPTPTPTPHRPGSIFYTYRGHTDRILTVAWSPNGKYIASGSLDKTVQVWATNPGEHFQPYIYRGHTAGVQTVAWSPDSNRVVSGAIDKTVQVWDALSGEHAAIYTGHTGFVNTVAWSPNGNYIATGSADKTVQILDATTGNHRYTYRGHTDTVSSVSWSPDGKYIASGSWDKTVQVWNALTGAVLYTYNGYNVKAAVNPSKGVLPDLIFAVAWSHNGKRIAAITQVYCGDVCAVVLGWDAYTQSNFTFWVDEPVFAMAWSPDDTRLVTSIVNSEQGTEHLSVQPPDGNFAQISQA